MNSFQLALAIHKRSAQFTRVVQVPSMVNTEGGISIRQFLYTYISLG